MRHKIWRWSISFTKKMHLLVHWWLSKTRINLCDNLHIVDFYKKGRWTYSQNCMPWKKICITRASAVVQTSSTENLKWFKLNRGPWRRALRFKAIAVKRKPFKNDEKCYLFHLKSFFRSQDIQIFVLTF